MMQVTRQAVLEVERANGLEALPPSQRSVPRQPDLHLKIDVAPFSRGAQRVQHRVEGVFVLGCVLKPGEKVEGLAEIAAVMQPSGDGGQGGHADPDVMRALSEDRAPLVQGEAPPGVGLADRDQRRHRRLWPTQAFLPRPERVGPRPRGEASVAYRAAQHPVAANVDQQAGPVPISNRATPDRASPLIAAMRSTRQGPVRLPTKVTARGCGHLGMAERGGCALGRQPGLSVKAHSSRLARGNDPHRRHGFTPGAAGQLDPEPGRRKGARHAAGG